MTDPYSVLGVSRSASMDDIKKAYRKLSRRYHPDANINNPNKAQAEEKFKQIQQAYQQIVDEKEHGTSYRSTGSGSYGGSSSGYGGYNGSYGGQSGYGGYNRGYSDGFGGFGGFGGYGGYGQSYGSSAFNGDPKLRAALNYLNSGHPAEALNTLDGMTERSAVWYYLHSIANSRLGNNVNAKEDARRAYEMEPNNPQYRELYQELQNGNIYYTQQGAGYGSPMCGEGGGNMSCAPCMCPLCCAPYCCCCC